MCGCLAAVGSFANTDYIFFSSRLLYILSLDAKATENLKRLTTLFGADWSKVQIIPKVEALYKHSSYLYRMTSLNVADALSTSLDADTIRDMLIPLVVSAIADPVPNVRFNCAKILGKFAKRVDSASVSGSIKPALATLMGDSDRDVKFYASEAHAAAV